MSSGSVSPSHLFEELLRKLGECHFNALQEIEAKVNKLKEVRCLDAQKLEKHLNCNRQLREQNRNLQDAISHLEERLRAGQCERCTSFKENLKNSQDENLQLIIKLKSENNTLEDKNRTLLAELKQIKTQSIDSSSEQEDGIIPDSPIFTSSLPVGSKLKKLKKIDKKNIRYAEKPLSGFYKSIFNEAVFTVKKDEQDEVLVLNTCEEDPPQKSSVEVDTEEVIADTCVFDFPNKHPIKAEKTTSQQNKYDCKLSSSAPGRTSSQISSPDSASESSRSLFPVVKHTLPAGRHMGKQKEESNAEQVQEGADMQEEDKRTQPELMNRISSHVRSVKRKPMDDQEEPGQLRNSSQDPPDSYLSPVFKKPNVLFKKDKAGGTKSLKQDQPSPKHGEEAIHPVEPTWSVDPALTLSVYDSDGRDEEAEEEEEAALMDSDCTWVSHSLLQGRLQNNNWEDGTSRLGLKANDSLEIMFDKTVDEEYKSFVGESQPCADDDDEEEEMKENKREKDPPEKTKALAIPYPHIAVVRRKDERRKLKGTTCKECETYYSHLPEEEKQKKLAACSRHRFHYIPPCTPENFWEVGFPSTQTCIERGYIREEEKPQERMRRRRPFSAVFSPKNSLDQS